MKIRNLILYAFAISTLLLSLAALLFAVQANRNVQESLKRMSETTESTQQSKLDIWHVMPTQMVSVDACFDAKTNLYVLRYQTQNSILFTNLGGKAVSIVDVGFSDTKHEYKVKREADLASPIGLLGSLDMFPGGSQEVFFSAAYDSATDQEYLTRQEAQKVISNLKPVQRAFWQFQLSDGTVYRVELKSLWFAAGRAAHNTDFSTRCGTV